MNHKKLTPEEEIMLSPGDVIGFGMPISEHMQEESIIYELCRESVNNDLPHLKPELLPIKKERHSWNITTERSISSNNELPAEEPDKIAARAIFSQLIDDHNLCNFGESFEPRTVCNKFEDEISPLTSKRKMKVTPQRTFINLCSSEDESDDLLLQNAVTNCERIVNTEPNVIRSEFSFSKADHSIVKDIIQHVDNDVEKPTYCRNNNQHASSMSLDNMSTYTKYTEHVKPENTMHHVSNLSGVSERVHDTTNATGVNRDDVLLDVQQNERMEHGSDDNKIYPLPNNNALQTDVDNFQDIGYSQDDEVIVISDDESYFSQNIVKIEDLKPKLDVCEEVFVEDAFDEWADVLKQTDDHDKPHLDMVNKQSCSTSYQVPSETDQLLPCEDHAGEVSDVNNFFPVLSQTFDDSDDDIPNESRVEVGVDKNVNKGDISREVDSKQHEDLQPIKDPHSFYGVSADYNFDRLKNRTGSLINSSKATQLTNALPVTISRKSNVEKPARTVIKSVERNVINDWKSKSTFSVRAIEKGKGKRDSLRSKIQHQMKYRIPIPGGGSAVPIGHRSVAVENVKSRVDQADTQLIRQGQYPQQAPKYSNANPADALTELCNPLPTLPETENNTNVEDGTKENDRLDTDANNDVPLKPKRSKVLQRDFPSRNDLFAEALMAASSVHSIKRKAPFKRLPPVKKRKNPTLQNLGVPPVEDISEHKLIKPRQTILLDDHLPCQRTTVPNKISPNVILQVQQTGLKIAGHAKKSDRHVTFSDDVKIIVFESTTVTTPTE